MDFELKLDEMGFEVDYREDIVHLFVTLDIKAKNRYYVIKPKS